MWGGKPHARTAWTRSLPPCQASCPFSKPIPFGPLSCAACRRSTLMTQVDPLSLPRVDVSDNSLPNAHITFMNEDRRMWQINP